MAVRGYGVCLCLLRSDVLFLIIMASRPRMSSSPRSLQTVCVAQLDWRGAYSIGESEYTV